MRSVVLALVACLWVGLSLLGCSPSQERGIEGLQYLDRVTIEGTEDYYDVDRDSDYDGDGVPDRKDRYPADPSSAYVEGDLSAGAEHGSKPAASQPTGP